MLSDCNMRTVTCGLFDVTGVLGTSFSLISLDVNFIDDTFYICFLPDLRGVRVAPSLVSVIVNSPVVDQQHQLIWIGDGYIGYLIENWMQSERWFDLCLFP
ncbi:hypothetical protein AMTRI_Chr05g60240 [Amborella trichopoda]